ncbi:MAG: nucleotide pyrophosphatase, partial [Gemmatimonadetes bacterium]|nr:nucleotide pyrophosphatase [Acidobacteriota bacterium]NIN73231.1 nucleotide pyrophosphatase [Gemmatimonadota bacterium]NIQ86401.1 nucleotide pyrophosphatase [Acidobacteriota bacterium]NIT11852.1 nucleotide pyrophosphatase [Acidobacteriota bacterium]
MTLPFTLTIADDGDSAEIEIDGGEKLTLNVNEYSDWVELTFKAGLGVKVSGIAKFYLISTEPHVNLYMTPI